MRLPCVASGSWILLHYHIRVQKDGSENSQEILSISDGYQQSQKHRNGQKKKKKTLCRLTVGKVLPYEAI